MSTERWAVVEIMGHRRHAGRVSEIHEFGASMILIEVPTDGDSFELHQYGGSAIFGIKWCTEEAARRAAEMMRPLPPTRQLTSSSPDSDVSPFNDGGYEPEGDDDDAPVDADVEERDPHEDGVPG